jgi:hypothetical protein
MSAERRSERKVGGARAGNERATFKLLIHVDSASLEKVAVAEKVVRADGHEVGRARHEA